MKLPQIKLSASTKETAKELLRLCLFGFASVVVTVLLDHFTKINNPELLVMVITGVLKLVDKKLHEYAKEHKVDWMLTGLTRF